MPSSFTPPSLYALSADNQFWLCIYFRVLIDNAFKPWKLRSCKAVSCLCPQTVPHQHSSLATTIWDLSVSKSLIHLRYVPLIPEGAIFKQQRTAVPSQTPDGIWVMLYTAQNWILEICNCTKKARTVLSDKSCLWHGYLNVRDHFSLIFHCFSLGSGEHHSWWLCLLINLNI